MSTLRYSFEPEKFLQAAAYLVRVCPATTKMKLFKLMFIADKRHMVEYGRPISGGRYVAMDFGPVHSEGYDLLKNPRDAFHRHVTLNGKTLALTGEDPGLDALSDSDVECLDAAARECLRPAALSDLFDRDADWTRSPRNEYIAYESFLAGAGADMREQAYSDQEVRDLVEDISLFEEPVGA